MSNQPNVLMAAVGVDADGVPILRPVKGVANPDGTAKIAISGGGGGTPGGAAGTLQFNNAGAFGAVSGSSVSGSDVTFGGSVTFAGGSTATNKPVISATQTWNSAGVAYDSDLANITDTASASTSTILRRQVGGADKLVVNKYGEMVITSGGRANQFSMQLLNCGAGTSVLHAEWASGGYINVGDLGAKANITVVNHKGFEFKALGSGDAAGIYTFDADSNAVSSGGALVALLSNGVRKNEFHTDGRISSFGTYTDASNYERGDVTANTADGLVIKHVAAGTGVARGVVVDLGTVTTNTPMTVRTTFNNAGAALTALKVNVTDTASAAGSLLQDWQINAASVTRLTKAGQFKTRGQIGGSYETHWGALDQYVVAKLHCPLGVGRLDLNSSGAIGWASDNVGITPIDVSIGRNSAGIIEVNNGTSGTFRDIKLRSLISTGGTITLSSYTVATLPTAASNAHAIVAVTDAASATYRGALTGGDTTKCLAYCDGTTWMAH